VIAYEMLTDHHPFRRTVTFGGAEPGGLPDGCGLVQAHSSLPAGASAFFDRALSADRARRPASPMEFLERLEQVMT
jgi:hypothetical protein